MKKRPLTLILFVPLLMAFQCEGNDPAPFDILDSTGLIGRWEIQDEVINDVISEMLPRCCEFLEFSPDDDITDNFGLMTYTDAQGLVNSGAFELIPTDQTILFIDADNNEFIFQFSLDESQENLTIDFTEDGTNYTQGWVRVE